VQNPQPWEKEKCNAPVTKLPNEKKKKLIETFRKSRKGVDHYQNATQKTVFQEI